MNSESGVLIVDDDPMFRKTFGDIFQTKGYSCSCSASGREALETVQRIPPAVALIDLKLEETSGLDVIRKIKDISPHTECIVLTGHASQASAIEAVNIGAFSYVQKPCDVEQLLVTVRRAIEKQESVKALRESEERYRNLFENSPISIWQADLSGFKARVDALRQQGVDDFRTYFDRHPEEVTRCAASAKVVDVNQSTLRLYKAESKKELKRNLRRIFAEESYESFREGLIALAEGRTRFGCEGMNRTLDGELRDVILQFAVAPGREESLSEVLLSVSDITEQKQAEGALSRQLEVDRAVAELSRSLIAAESAEDISYLVLEHAKRLTRSTYGYVGYIDPSSGYLVSPTLTRDVWDACQVADKSFVFKKFAGLWGWVLKNRQPLLTNAATEDPRSTGIPPGHMPIDRFLSVPATLGGVLVGQVALANPDRDYTQADLDLAEQLASLYALAIQRERAEETVRTARDELEIRVAERTASLEEANRQLQDEIEERIKAEDALRANLNLLNTISHAQSQFISNVDPGELFQGLLQRLLDITGSRSGFIGEVFYLADDKPYMTTHAVLGPVTKHRVLSESVSEAERAAASDYVDRYFRTIVKEQRPVTSNDPVLELGWEEETGREFRLQSVMGLPLLTGDEMVGMIGVADRPGGYDAEMVGYLRPFLTTCANLVKAYKNDQLRRRAEEALRNMAEGVSAVTGEAFLNSLVEYLADTLHVDYAFVAELSDPEADTVNVIAARGHELLEAHPKYMLQNTPCGNVLGKELCCYCYGVQDLFPHHPLLTELRVESYIGTPLFDSSGLSRGLIAVMDRKPLTDTAIAKSMLQVFATRASAELERKRTQDALEAERQRLFSLLDTLPAFVYLKAPDYSIRFANRYFKERFGEPAGRSCYEVLRGRQTPCEDCPTFRVFETRKPGKVEFSTIRERSYEIYDYPFYDVDGSELVLELGIDITDRKRLEKEVIEIGERERRRLGQDLHDGLGQHLTGIAFMSKVLEKKLRSKNMAEADDVGKIAEQIQQTINHARVLARGLSPVSLDSDGFMSAVHELSTNVEELYGVSCTFQCPDPILIEDNAVAMHLYRIVQEAVNNAVKHGKAGAIRIKLASTEDRADLVVEDDGLGIPRNLPEGKGMGLHIMNYRAAMVGGSLDVRPRNGRGTVVHCAFRIPAGSRRRTE